ncbi:hypothetical protein HWV62_33359 [Athelia sp. TMB]|nr:hypothetical protein HWV62_33359 [Athelia sp. TMB]
MSLNERDTTIAGAKAVDTYPGVANPTSFTSNGNPMAANFVDDPTSDDRGAGAGPDFQGGAQAQRGLNATAGVVGHDRTIESTNIDPLNENSNKGARSLSLYVANLRLTGCTDDGFANVTSTGKADAHMEQARGMGQRAYEAASGAANLAYGHVVGDEAAKQAGQEALYGERQ